MPIPKLRVIKGGTGLQFVCPWCGSTFERRYVSSDGVMSLEEHWKVDPRCRNNRNVNNPTQSKYEGPDDD